MVLRAAASLASAVLPKGVLGLVTEHPRFEYAAAKLGLPRDSPFAVFLATALVVALPAVAALTASRAFGSRTRRERQRANDDAIRVVLVTGASGGLGALIVAALRRAFPDATVYGTSRSGWEATGEEEEEDEEDDDDDVRRSDRTPLGAEKRSVPSETGPPLLKLDVHDEESVAKLIDTIQKRHGRLDVLVNNAGSVVATHAANTSELDCLDQMSTNFFGAVRMVRRATRVMKRAKNVSRDRRANAPKGRIINVGSIGGRIGLPYQSMYSASKAALAAWTDALRVELRVETIFVSLVEPGDLRPGMVNARKSKKFDDDPVAKRATDIMRKEESEGTDPARVAEAIVRLCRSQKIPPGRVLVGPDAWLVETLTRLVPHGWKEYFLASHYRVPPRDNAWIRV